LLRQQTQSIRSRGYFLLESERAQNLLAIGEGARRRAGCAGAVARIPSGITRATESLYQTHRCRQV